MEDENHKLGEKSLLMLLLLSFWFNLVQPSGPTGTDQVTGVGVARGGWRGARRVVAPDV